MAKSRFLLFRVLNPRTGLAKGPEWGHGKPYLLTRDAWDERRVGAEWSRWRRCRSAEWMISGAYGVRAVYNGPTASENQGALRRCVCEEGRSPPRNHPGITITHASAPDMILCEESRSLTV